MVHFLDAGLASLVRKSRTTQRSALAGRKRMSIARRQARSDEVQKLFD